MKFALSLLFAMSSQVWAGWTVSTYNVRNFDRDDRAGNTNIPLLQTIIKSVKSDVMAFNEIVNVKAFEQLVASTLPEYKYEISSCGGGGKQKIAIAWNPQVFTFKSKTEDLRFSDIKETCGSLRPLFMVTLTSKNLMDYSFAGVHLKAGGQSNAMARRWEQYELLESFAKRFQGKNLIMLGDFNTTGYTPKNDDYVKFSDFMNGAGMRTLADNLGCTNYWPGTLNNGLYEASIIDHIVIQEKLASSVVSSRIGSHCEKFACRPTSPLDLGTSYKEVSDHCPLQVSFK
jgi:endonuclease/exonuclease/phosphatase family metal-dependent hydrolase